jgi:crotonobetainyl-CoA:carnitine CoA-transferase CaiB-like acyl-CoA transferase
MNTEAYGGSLLVDQHNGQPHIASRVALGAEVGGINAASAILAALLRAERTGRGAELDVSCWDAAVDLLRYDVSLYSAECRTMTPAGDLGPLYDLYWTADHSLLMFCAIEAKFWTNFCEGVGRPDLLERRGTSEAVDYGKRDDTRADLEDLFAQRTLNEWLDAFMAWDVPACPVLSLEELVAHPHLAARRFLNAGEGPLPNLGDPVIWSGECRPGLDARPAPAIGADTDAVLASWLEASS